MGVSGVQEWLVSGVYGLETLVLKIGSVSFGWKHDFQEGVKLVLGSCVCTYTKGVHPSKSRPASLLKAERSGWETTRCSQVLVSVLWNIGAWMHPLHGCPQGVRRLSVREPRRSLSTRSVLPGWAAWLWPLLIASQLYSFEWKLAKKDQSVLRPDLLQWEFAVISVHQLAGCEQRERCTGRRVTDSLVDPCCLWRMMSWNQYADQECSEYLKKSLWLCCICVIPAVVFVYKKKKSGGGDANTIFVQIRKEFGDGALEKRGTIQCLRRTFSLFDWKL